MSLNYQTLKNIIKEVIEEGVSPESLGNDLSSIEATKKDYDRAEKMDTQAKVERQAKAIKDSKKLIQRLKAVEEILGREAAQPFYDKAVELGFSDEQISSLGGSGKPTAKPKPKPKVEDIKEEPVVEAPKETAKETTKPVGLTKTGNFRGKQTAKDYSESSIKERAKAVGEEYESKLKQLYSDLDLQNILADTNRELTDADYEKYLDNGDIEILDIMPEYDKKNLDDLIRMANANNPSEQRKIIDAMDEYKKLMTGMIEGNYIYWTEGLKKELGYGEKNKEVIDSYIDEIIDFNKDVLDREEATIIESTKNIVNNIVDSDNTAVMDDLNNLKDKYVELLREDNIRSLRSSNEPISMDSNNTFAKYARKEAIKASDGNWYSKHTGRLDFDMSTPWTYEDQYYKQTIYLYVFDNNLYGNKDAYEKAIEDAGYDTDNPQMNPDIISGDELKFNKNEIQKSKDIISDINSSISNKIKEHNNYITESERLSKLKSKRSQDKSQLYKDNAEDLLIEIEDLLGAPEMFEAYDKVKELTELITPEYNRKYVGTDLKEYVAPTIETNSNGTIKLKR